LSITTFVRLVGMLIPAVAIYALPMGMLTGVLLTLGRLSADSEITAMRAAGLSLARIARPVLILGFLGCALGLYVNFQSMPAARVQYHKDLDAAVAANPLSFIVPKTFIRNFKGFVITSAKNRARSCAISGSGNSTAKAARPSSSAPNPAASITTLRPTSSFSPSRAPKSKSAILSSPKISPSRPASYRSRNPNLSASRSPVSLVRQFFDKNFNG
jgi:hypothetical protein